MAKKTQNRRKDSSKMDHISKCQANECKKLAENKCKYCNRYYCEEHTEARLATNPWVIWTVDRKNPLWQELADEWKLEGGHACANYTGLRYKKYREESNRHDVDWNAVLDRRRSSKTGIILSQSKPYEEIKTEKQEMQKQESWYQRHAKVVNFILFIIVILLLLSIALGH